MRLSATLYPAMCDKPMHACKLTTLKSVGPSMVAIDFSRPRYGVWVWDKRVCCCCHKAGTIEMTRKEHKDS